MSGALNHGVFAWSPEAIDCLRLWRAEGLSSGQISTELAKKFRSPVSRSAVIGKLSRLGIQMPEQRKKITMALARPKPAPKPLSPKERTGKDQIAERRAVDLLKAAKAEARVIPLRPAEDPDTIAEAPCCIMDLNHASCRWPLKRTADNGETLFCANEKAETGAYCTGHARRAYSRVINKDQRETEKRRLERHRAEALAAGRRESLFGFGLAKRFA